MSERTSEVTGRVLRAHVSAEADGASAHAARERFVAAAAATREGGRLARPRLALLAAAAALLASVVALVVVRGERHPMTFAVGHDRRAGAVSEHLAATRAEALPLYFSDGTALALEPSTRARVERTTVHGATVVVEDGTIDANVVHADGTEWAFRAGPYVVHVTGTSFLLAWSPESGVDLRMRAGAVRIEGPDLPRGLTVQGHERFHSRDRKPAAAAMPLGPVEPTSTDDDEPEVAPAVAVDDEPEGQRNAPEATRPAVARAPSAASPEGPTPMPRPEVAPAPAAAGASSPVTTGGSREPRESWSQLVARGEYARVVEAARAAGTSAVLATANETDLGALADAARLGGSHDLAGQALMKLRERHGTTSRGKTAAFLLGRMADDGGQAAAAARWYATYLVEAPSGPFAAEALGRRMLALRRSNDAESTRSAALEYLARYPGGPYARVARELGSP